MADKPSVLFVCVHNAGRSQMAAGFLAHLAGDAIEVRSAGSAPAASINPVAVQAMAELGIDISAQQPKILTPEAVETSDVVITMGCGDTCPFFPGVSYRDWVLDDPAGQGIEAVRPIRDQIRARVEQLIAELLPPRNPDGGDVNPSADSGPGPTWAPVDACTLPTAEQPLREAEFENLFAAALTAVDRLSPTHVRLTLRAEAEQTARDLAARETACCSFFSFEFTSVGGDVIEMDIKVPPTQVPVLDGLLSQPHPDTAR